MCTVTFLPTKSGFIFTSNRDELNTRETLTPTFHIHDELSLYYPKDKVAGGTWIATDGKTRVACLLNGAFEKHNRKESYAKSRGRILVESLESVSFDEFLEHSNFTDIEPFTIILLEFGDAKRLREIRWDEKQLHIIEKDFTGFYIWSSATLYSSEQQTIRQKWFEDWIRKFQKQEDFNMLHFHLQEFQDQPEIGICMAREKGMQTVSVSQINYQSTELQFSYYDLLTKNFQSHLLTTGK